jgi:hypothetical protein
VETEEQVLFLRNELGVSYGGQYSGGLTHIMDSKFMEPFEEIAPRPGHIMSNGLTSVLRHEKGHKLSQQLYEHHKEWWSEFTHRVAGIEDLEKKLTKYATKNIDETFAELFAVITAPAYESAHFPAEIVSLERFVLKKLNTMKFKPIR